MLFLVWIFRSFFWFCTTGLPYNLLHCSWLRFHRCYTLVHAFWFLPRFGFAAVRYCRYSSTAAHRVYGLDTVWLHATTTTVCRLHNMRFAFYQFILLPAFPLPTTTTAYTFNLPRSVPLHCPCYLYYTTFTHYLRFCYRHRFCHSTTHLPLRFYLVLYHHYHHNTVSTILHLILHLRHRMPFTVYHHLRPAPG